MSLYSIPLPTQPYHSNSPFLDYTDEEKRTYWMEIRTKYRQQQGEYGLSIYVSMSIFLMLSDSLDCKLINFKNRGDNKFGTYDGASLYFSSELSENEYYIGLEEIEIKQYKRRYKLNKIINKL
jgi:hypothetical protein